MAEAHDHDPRIYFAAERTVLAWLRTGLAVVGIGFLVARFGLFLQVLQAPQREPQTPLLSTLIGVGFVLSGAVMIGVSGWQHVRFCRRLTQDQLPPMYSIRFSQIVVLFVALLSGILAVYLLATARR